MGQIVRILAQGNFTADALPYACRFVVEDCVGETVHLHMGNIRTEFTPEQFVWFADQMTKAAAEIRKHRDI